MNAEVFRQVPMEVIYYLAGYARTLPTAEERGGAAQLVNQLVRLRDPQETPLMAAANEKKKAKALHG
jgi:hypothetical protein